MTADIISIDADKPKIAKVTDTRGRVITLKKPGALAQYRIVETAGTSAENGTYMSMVLPLIFVTAIDSDPIPQPSTKLQLEALIQQLDEDGIAAVMKGVRDEFGAAVAP
jgi:hypothetical protein